jgi:hypothetical protein
VITYPQPIITVDQTIRLVELAVSSKTVELERAVAMAIQSIVKPPMIYEGDIDINMDFKHPGAEQ